MSISSRSLKRSTDLLHGRFYEPPYIEGYSRPEQLAYTYHRCKVASDAFTLLIINAGPPLGESINESLYENLVA